MRRTKLAFSVAALLAIVIGVVLLVRLPRKDSRVPDVMEGIGNMEAKATVADSAVPIPMEEGAEVPESVESTVSKVDASVLNSNAPLDPSIELNLMKDMLEQYNSSLEAGSRLDVDNRKALDKQLTELISSLFKSGLTRQEIERKLGELIQWRSLSPRLEVGVPDGESLPPHTNLNEDLGEWWRETPETWQMVPVVYYEEGTTENGWYCLLQNSFVYYESGKLWRRDRWDVYSLIGAEDEVVLSYVTNYYPGRTLHSAGVFEGVRLLGTVPGGTGLPIVAYAYGPEGQGAYLEVEAAILRLGEEGPKWEFAAAGEQDQVSYWEYIKSSGIFTIHRRDNPEEADKTTLTIDLSTLRDRLEAGETSIYLEAVEQPDY